MHNLNIQNGKASMFYSGEMPWHKLGTKVDGLLNSSDAIEKAQLNYNVLKIPVQYTHNATLKTDKNHFVTVREDTGDALGNVGARYEVLQNKQAFSFFDAIVGVKEAMYETAGALGKGERVWMLAKLPGYIKTVGDDITEKFLLLTNTHDGSGAVQVLFTPIRVVCQNTLNVAIGSNTKTFKIRHTSSIGDKVREAQKALGIINHQFTMFEDVSRKFAATEITRDVLRDYIKKTGLVPNVDSTDQSTRAQNILDEVNTLFVRGKGADLPGAKGTLWGAFNAVAEYVDYYRGTNLQSRADSLLFGSGASIKQKAWDVALEMTK